MTNSHPLMISRPEQDCISPANHRDNLLAMHRALQIVRLAEMTLARRYREQEMRTPSHFGIGQEAVAVGVCMASRRHDPVYSHHRCHNHYLAAGGDFASLVGELYGRTSGCSGGRGGSVHLTDLNVGFVVSSAILGQTPAVAVGSALSFAMDKVPRVAIAFFGDGACEEGAIYESMNFAAIHKLPVLFVCENNGFSTESPLSVRQPTGTSLVERAQVFKWRAQAVDGNDVLAVNEAARILLKHCRDGHGPAFLECHTYRWLEHVGPMFDHELDRSYRSRSEVEQWIRKCPLSQSAQRLFQAELTDINNLQAQERQIQSEIDRVIEKERQAPWPDVSTLFDHI